MEGLFRFFQLSPMTFPSPTARGALLVVAATAGFATLGTLATLAYKAGMSSPVFVTLRALVGALVLAGVLLAQPGLRVPLGTQPISLELAVGGLLVLAAAALVRRPAPGRSLGRSSPVEGSLAE